LFNHLFFNFKCLNKKGLEIKEENEEEERQQQPPQSPPPTPISKKNTSKATFKPSHHLNTNLVILFFAFKFISIF